MVKWKIRMEEMPGENNQEDFCRRDGGKRPREGLD